MLFKLLNLLLFVYIAGCGQQIAGDDREALAAESISSSFAGLAFVGVNSNAQIDNGKLYYYDFKAGKISEIANLESGDPLAYWDGSELLVFNRQESAHNVTRYDLTKSESATDSFSISGLSPGDPIAAIDLGANKKLLATPFSGGLNYLDTSTKRVTKVTGGFPGIDTLRATALYKSGARVWVTHRAHGNVQLDNTADGEGLAFRMTVGTDNTVAVATADSIDLATTYPGGIFKRKDQNMAVVGLCFEDMSGCKAGSTKISGGSASSTQEFDSASLEYDLLNNITEGPGTDYVYALVRSRSEGTAHVVKMDLFTGESTAIHDFTGDRLFGLMYDDSSDTLFIGGVSELGGELYLYRNDKELAKYELNTMPYNGAFIQ